MPFGVAAARFGGLTSADVINAWPLGRLEEFLRKGRSSLGYWRVALVWQTRPGAGAPPGKLHEEQR
jgi:hypothetical protein